MIAGRNLSSRPQIRVGIFADDLTGALDAAAPFARLGIPAYVSINHAVPSAAARYRVVAVNMDSRQSVHFQPFDRGSRASRDLRAAGFDLLLNKVDSTLRGHAGMEARAALSPEPADQARAVEREAWLGPRVALLAPAFPAQGRTVIDGQLLIDGVPLTETEVGRDPLSPAPASDVREVVTANVGAEPASVSLAEVRRPGALSSVVAGLSETPPAFVAVDAETDADLDAIAAVALQAGGDVVLAGSGGIAAAVARAIADDQRPVAPDSPEVAAGPVLAVAGSQREVTARQIEQLRATRDVCVVDMDAALLLDDDAAPAERDRVLALGAERLRGGGHLVLRLSAPGGGEGLAGEADALRTRQALAGELGVAAYRLCRRTPAGALMLVGGDTAQAVLRAVGADGIVLRGEPLPGVAAGAIEAGLLAGVTVVSKAGAFGGPETLVRLLDYLEGKPPAR